MSRNLRSGGASRSWLARCLVLLPVLATAPAAAQQGEFGVDVTGGLGYSANPFLVEGDGTGSAFAEFSLTPRYTVANERGETVLEATYQHTEYFEDYGSSRNFSVSARMNRRLTERSSLQASLEFDSSILGERGDIGFDPALPVDPTQPITGPIAGDELLIGQRARRNLARANLGYTVNPSVRDTISIQGNVERSSFPDRGDIGLNGDGLGYWSYGADASYSRALSELSSAGGRVAIELTDYDRAGASSQIIQPQIFYKTQLWERWEVEAAIGALFIRSRSEGETDTSTGLSANLSACRRGERSVTCVNAYRGASATGFGEARTETGASLAYSYQLRERDFIRFNAGYSRLGSGMSNIPSLFDGRSEVASANLTYDRGLSNRLSVGATLGYRDFFGNERSPQADLNGQVFVRARLGEFR